mmetsp:Transcript_1471/g.4068  ORF Transcript_1471/g.4068 Transcript_1471/m.4068 type:complete len:212 (-) Transcript_1471:831-1466(-)
MRTPAGLTPAAICWSVVSCWCVVEAGWMTSVRASPTFARWAHIFRAVMNFLPRSRAWSSVSPANSNVNTEPKQPGRKYFLASSCDGCDGKEIDRTEPSLTASWPLSHSARAFAFSQWALQRSDSVSNPWMSWKALKGAIHPPMSLSVLTRASRMKTRLQASTPKIGWLAKSPPWYDSCGPATSGYLRLPSAFFTRQSNDEPSTMMPPMLVP